MKQGTSTGIKAGQLLTLGHHRLLCGDATDPAVVRRLIGDQSIRAVIADPPYGVGYVESKAALTKISVPKVITGDQPRSEAEYRQFTTTWLAPAIPNLTDANAIYIFNSDKMVFALREGMLEAGVRFGQLLTWVKQQPVMGRLDYQPQSELIAYGSVGQRSFRKAKDRNVIFFPRPQRSPHHATQKPVGLIRRLILNSSEVGDVIYDPFGGSGTTLLAAEQTKRRCLMVECDPAHCRTIVSRWEQLTGQKAEVARDE